MPPEASCNEQKQNTAKMIDDDMTNTTIDLSLNNVDLLKEGDDDNDYVGGDGDGVGFVLLLICPSIMIIILYSKKQRTRS
jgi:hypothetical protein